MYYLMRLGWASIREGVPTKGCEFTGGRQIKLFIPATGEAIEVKLDGMPMPHIFKSYYFGHLPPVFINRVNVRIELKFLEEVKFLGCLSQLPIHFEIWLIFIKLDLFSYK